MAIEDLGCDVCGNTIVTLLLVDTGIAGLQHLCKICFEAVAANQAIIHPIIISILKTTEGEK